MSKEIKIIKLKNIYLATKNPRIADKINFNNVNAIFFKNKQINNDIKNLKTILSYEGNLNNLLELFQSLKVEYNEMLELPILIESNIKGKYISIEGSRRIMVLKCLNSIITFPKNIKDWNILNIEDEYKIDNEDEEINNEKIKNNFNAINKIINEYKKSNLSNNEIELKFNVIEKNDKQDKEISIAIFSNHVTGNKRGKRNWNRGKTLNMYMNFWQTININDEKQKIQKISNLLNKSEPDVKKNLYSASLIYYLIDKSEQDKNNFYNKIKISSLELPFIKTFINFNDKNRWKNEIQYNQNLNYQEIILKSKNNAFTDKDFAKFIINSFKKNYFNTRGVIKEEESLNEIFLFFGKSKKLKEKDFKKDIKDIGSYNIYEAIKYNENFINPNLKIYINLIKKTKKIANEIEFNVSYNNELSNNELSRLNPFKIIFKNLFIQYKLLLKNKNIINIEDFPINAIMSTFRSLIENLCYLLMYDENLLIEFKNYSHLFNELRLNNKKIEQLSKEEIKQLNFQSIFLNSEISFLHKTYNFLRDQFEAHEEKILNAFKKLMNNLSIEKIKNLKIIFDNNVFRQVSKIIHSPHLLFLENNPEELKILLQNISFLEKLIQLFKELKIIQ